MAQYHIDLDGNIKADIRTGKVFKKRARLFNHWPFLKFNSEVRTGYIVMVENVLQKIKTEYHLLKTKEGKWLTEAEHELASAVKIQGKWNQHKDDSMTLSIKKAIDDYENKQ